MNGRQVTLFQSQNPSYHLNRVNGQLAVSRAFGDVNFKYSKEESGGGGAEKPLNQRYDFACRS